MIVFKGGTLIDGTGAAPVHDTGVVIRDGRVEAVTTAGANAWPKDAEIIDVSGKTVLPGLIDCHDHMALHGYDLARRWNLDEPASTRALRTAQAIRQTLARGYTAVRDAGGLDAGFRQAVDEGLIRGPRLYTAITIISPIGGIGDRVAPSGHECLVPPDPALPLGVARGVEDVRNVVRTMDWYTPNPERARKLLADAGYPNGFKTTLKLVPTFPTMVAGAQVIAAQLKKIGVEVQIIQEEYGVWIKGILKPTFDYDLTMNIAGGEPDPDSLLYRRFHSDEKQWNNDGDPEIDVLLDQGKLTIERAKRKEIYDKIQRLMVEKGIQIWTFAPDIIDVMQSHVHYEQHFTTAYYGFRTAWLDR
jgi:ABC-type transport system substrate-binding protein